MKPSHALAAASIALNVGCGASPSEPTAADAASDVAVLTPVEDAAVAVDVPPLPTDGPPTAAAEARLVAGLAVQSVALFQSVKVTLATAGEAVSERNAPVVAGRQAVVRVYVTPGAAWVARAVTAELVVTREGAPERVYRDARLISRASRDEDLASTFTFTVDREEITEETSYRVQLLAADGAPVPVGEASEARFPTDGASAALGALSDLGGLDLVLVPFRYDTDGSGRLPDTSTAQIARVRALLLALYPISAVNITVRPAQVWTRALTTTGNVDFSSMNEALVRQRSTDRAPTEAYYYGLVSPAVNRAVYCGRSCTTGQSFVVRSPMSASMRVGSGVGFEGEGSAQTLAHELGHEHGRSHAPCGTTNPDSDFPYRTGSIGVWGYDARIRAYVPPSRYSDFMGYCEPEWISDYTFTALFERVRAVHGASDRAGARAEVLRFLHVDGATARWGSTITLESPEDEDRRAVVWLGDGDATLRSEQVARFARGDEGGETLLVPQGPSGARRLRIGALTLPLP